jgi:hypothetical protein
MRTKLSSEMYKMFSIVAIAALMMFGVSCDDLGRVQDTINPLPSCTAQDPPGAALPQETSGKMPTCKCTLEQLRNVPACCNNQIHAPNPCPRETANPTCQMAATGIPQITIPTGLVQVPPNRAACEPFAITWIYRNVGNQTAQPPLSATLTVTEEEPTEVPPNERLNIVREVPWKSLAPCENDPKTVPFQEGIRPHRLDTGLASYAATLRVRDRRGTQIVETVVTRLRFNLIGSRCP